jgi:A/G-specific adenine glycosylase
VREYSPPARVWPGPPGAKRSNGPSRERRLPSMDTKLTPRALGSFQNRLLAWFGKHRRDLPWRSSRDPYRVWLAEVMLQQTRIAAVVRYYDRFLSHFPSVESLARARERNVLKLWSGLGYYSRARNLHRAAKQIVAKHNGQFPRTLEFALELPGIGPYTAAAVLSIAYQVPLAVVDGNVRRVLARISAIRGDLLGEGPRRRIAEAAETLLVERSPGDWNQALMELGERICTPQNPRCEVCPVARFCRAQGQKLTGEIPAPRRKRAPVNMRIAAAILCDPRCRTILVEDPGAHDDVVFSRMWQFPAVEVARRPKAELVAHLRASLAIDARSLEALPAMRHAVTYRNLTLLPFLARVAHLPKQARTRIVPLSRFGELPVSAATHKIAVAARNRTNSPRDSRELASPEGSRGRDRPFPYSEPSSIA